MLQGMIGALTHFSQRDFLLRHLKVMIAVEMLIRIAKGKSYPRIETISKATGVPASELEKPLRELVEARYLHEMLPRFGPVVMTYKLGAMGGTVMRQLSHRGKRKANGHVVDED